MATQPLRVEAGIVPKEHNASDLGHTGAKFKDLHLQGTAQIGTHANVGGNLTVTGSVSAGSGMVDDGKAIAYAIALG
jgi:hypothetical protein|tara:strand:- start:6780 stop:7010 length:231 start_codon:yes stop_codon:yes gene_type:complete